MVQNDTHIGAAMPARSPSPTRKRRTTGLVAAAALAAAGLSTAATAGTAQAAAAPLTANWYESAPYYYTLDSAAPDLGQVISATGQKAFLLSFILADGGCTPSWDGTDPVSGDTQVAAVINEVRADGGDVGASEGGATGNKLGQECSTPAATAAAYQSVISKYSLHYFDFDLEEPEIESSTAVANEIGAAQILQSEDPGLLISITIPTTTTGANYFGQLALDQAASDGFVPSDWSLMPFDNGFSGGASQQQSALTAFNAQLVSTFGWSSAVAWNHEGISQMNGQSDTGEHFQPADFASNLSFAESHNMSRYTFWDENRDRQCNPVNEATNGDCSSVAQSAYQFTGYDASFGKWAPTSAPVAPPKPACVSTVFSASTVYTQGDEVYYSGANWTAAYWTQGGTPPTDYGAWKDDGPCSGS
jgi:chitinase